MAQETNKVAGCMWLGGELRLAICDVLILFRISLRACRRCFNFSTRRGKRNLIQFTVGLLLEVVQGCTPDGVHGLFRT
jgi:hypothetical protein